MSDAARTVVALEEINITLREFVEFLRSARLETEGEMYARMLGKKPASEGGKVECQHCRKGVNRSTDHCSMDQGPHGPLAYDCKPAQPEPVAPEMPEAVRNALRLLPWNEGHALGEWWRAHAAQLAPAVAMSPELERVLDFAWSQACETDGYTQPRVEADILAVRAQAAEAGKVRLPKVNEAIRLLEDWRKFGDLETNEMPYGDTAAFLAAEGKVAG